MALPEIVAPRDYPTETMVVRKADKFGLWNSDTNQNDFILGENISKGIQYSGDSIETSDFLIPVNGIKDSHNNRAVQKKISWNPYEDWKSVGVSGGLRFPRGEAGVFGEYENLWHNPTLNNVALATVGEWTKVTATITGTTYMTVVLSVAQDEIFASFIMKKGNRDNARGLVTLGGVPNIFSFDFTTGLITTTGGSFDTLTATEIVENQEYLIHIVKTGVASGTDEMRIYAAESPVISGDYTYIKDILYVGGIDYPVPYVKGTHTADSWVHPVNWTESSDWTIDIWFKPQITEGYLLDLRDLANTDDGFLFFHSVNVFYVATHKNGVSTTVALSPQPNYGEYNHIKLVYKSDTSIRVYLNGILNVTVTTNIPIYTDLNPIARFGYRHEDVQWLNGYISDIMIRPSEDVTTDHHSLGLPWTNPENPFNAEHGAYVDKYGNYAGETFTAAVEDAYTVVEQYTIGDQTVTKWSNGDMLIEEIIITSSATPTSDGSLWVGQAVDFVFLEKFIEANIIITAFASYISGADPVSVGGLSGTPISVDALYGLRVWYAIATASTSSRVTLSAKGKWK